MAPKDYAAEKGNGRTFKITAWQQQVAAASGLRCEYSLREFGGLARSHYLSAVSPQSPSFTRVHLKVVRAFRTSLLNLPCGKVSKLRGVFFFCFLFYLFCILNGFFIRSSQSKCLIF